MRVPDRLGVFWKAMGGCLTIFVVGELTFTSLILGALMSVFGGATS